MKSRWKAHCGIRYFHLDLSDFGSNDAAIIAECDAADAVIMAEPERSVLLLNDVRGTEGSLDIIKYFQMSAERTNPYVIRAAVVGVTGVKSFLLQVVNRFSNQPIVRFDTYEAAQDWLVESASIEE